MSNKPKVVKDYAKLDKEVKHKIKLKFPDGFENYLIKFPNKDGDIVSALPFETDDFYYLIRMTVRQAQEIAEDEDDDFEDEDVFMDNDGISEDYEDEDDEDEDFDD